MTLLYRIAGFLEEDFFAMHVKHVGLKIWNVDTGQLNRVEVPEYAGDIDNIRATPDGRFLVVGFANVGIIRFFRVWKDEAKLSSLDDGKISIEYTSFETDDNLTVMLFHHRGRRSLELHAIKWIFEFGDKVNLRALRKMDEQRVQMEGQAVLNLPYLEDESLDQDESLMDRSHQGLMGEQGAGGRRRAREPKSCFARLCQRISK